MKRHDRHWVETLGELTARRDAADEILDLSVGQPDGDPPEAVVEALARLDKGVNRYPPAKGAPSLRAAVADWFSRRYGVAFGPEEVLVTHGSKVGVSLAPLAFTEPGDVVAVPTPGYPTYGEASRQLDRRVEYLELRAETRYEPSSSELGEAFGRARMAYLSYPSNPTGVAGSEDTLKAAVAAARQTGTVVIHDAAYAELRHDGRRLSIFSVDGADDVAVELHSLSKSFHLAGYRIGFALARPHLLSRLSRVHGILDTGAARISQHLAEAALRSEPDFASRRRQRDIERTTTMARGLIALGCEVCEPDGAFYVWFRPPAAQIRAGRGWEAIVRDAGIACAPGAAFGPGGEGWVRFTCTSDEGRFAEVLARLDRLWT